jgi:hypothetical protein
MLYEQNLYNIPIWRVRQIISVQLIVWQQSYTTAIALIEKYKSISSNI